MTSCATRGGRWSPPLIVAMVLGFVVWWPLGFVALAAILWGDRLPRERMREAANRARGEFDGFARGFSGLGRNAGWSFTGNHAFEDYRTETLRRMEEERARLVEEERAFAEWMRNLRRARDKEEFDRFMAERRGA